VVISNSKAVIDEAETLLTAIRGGVLVHLQDTLYPHHLKVPVDLARSLNECAAKIGNDAIAHSADTLEAWLTLLASETGPISHTRTRSLLDQISELEVELVAYRASASASTSMLDVGDFVDESFRSLSQHEPDRRSDEDAEDVSEDSFEVDSEMLEVFREEAGSLLQNIRTNLETLSRIPDDRGALWEVKRNAHTLKGAAGVVGLGKLSTLAHRVEDLLSRLSETEANSNVRILGLLIKASSCLSSLAAGDASTDVDAQVESLEREFADALLSISTSAADPEPGEEVSGNAGTEVETHAATPPAEPPLRKGSIVRVSLERLDDLVKMVRGLEASRGAFEQHIEELEKQLDEATNNKLRLQSASGKIEKISTLRSQYTFAEGQRQRPELDQIAYELAETAGDASVINTLLTSVRVRFGELYDRQGDLIANVHARLMRLRNVEFGTIATRLERMVRVTCEEEGKKAKIEIANGSFEVDTQTIDMLIEPLMHLLKNAVVHGIELPDIRRMLGKGEVGRVAISVASEDSNVVLTISDDGRGIANQPLVEKAVASGRITRDEANAMTAEEVRELIFLPGLTTAEKINLNAGRGVGMSIVRESIAAANGTIAIETWPQKGTTFTIRIPNPFTELRYGGQRVPAQTRDEDPHKLKALVVDDSPSVRLAIARTIERAGWRAESAKNGLDALEKLTTMNRLPQIILSDIEMPFMGGHELLAALRAELSLKDIPVIIVSSRAGAEDRKRALAAGALDYITKPYDEDYLVELIERLALRTESVF
jgi:CheY-like chemotaxis protein/HPt (histidine-containing phosphotransfer) domain-containing protein/two-component sensor histidine kinase